MVSPFFFNGFNSYWLMHISAEPSQRNKVSDVFRQASAAGLSVCRTWAFSDGGYQALQISPGVYDERVFQGLDFVISEARKNGIRLVLTLSNNYQDFGGRPQYVNWAKSAGVSVNNDDDFYINAVIKRVITRVNTITGVAYKDDPTIMAWELMNEPRCQIDYSGKTLNGWVQEMASYVKSIDNKHLLTVGMEGFMEIHCQKGSQSTPATKLAQILLAIILLGRLISQPYMHILIFGELNGKDDNAQMAFLQTWTTSHLTDSRTIIKKPMIFAEFGKSSKDPGYSINARDSFLNAVYTNIYSSARSGGMGGGLVWQIMAEGMESYYDGYEIVLSKIHQQAVSLLNNLEEWQPLIICEQAMASMV
ncbi:Mannan endo-1,4-beta-mannosidase 5 [Vitis vinifera]|uniref:mannan endo-1,4-beta-mannosidase n=1 Tax=Vitis vinifera TaxID=29760 RepID=A0A438FRL2_VITVI|nr:Mannan endo-1,4-beta-mannosidase 5 [Vitis vinifera]